MNGSSRKKRHMDTAKESEQQTADADGHEVALTDLEHRESSRESNVFSSSLIERFRVTFFPRSPRRSKAHIYQVIVTCGLLSFLAVGAASPLPTQAFSQRQTPDFAGIDRYVTAQMHGALIPGLALGIVHGDRIVHLRGFGVANPAGQPVTPQTPFILGSLSKSFTALAIMQLIDAGKMALESPVQLYLPWFRVADRNASAQMTVYQLLHQTSGLPPTAGEEAMAGTGEASLEQRVRELSRVVLTQPVGTTFNTPTPTTSSWGSSSRSSRDSRTVPIFGSTSSRPCRCTTVSSRWLRPHKMAWQRDTVGGLGFRFPPRCPICLINFRRPFSSLVPRI